MARAFLDQSRAYNDLRRTLLRPVFAVSNLDAALIVIIDFIGLQHFADSPHAGGSYILDATALPQDWNHPVQFKPVFVVHLFSEIPGAALPGPHDAPWGFPGLA